MIAIHLGTNSFAFIASLSTGEIELESIIFDSTKSDMVISYLVLVFCFFYLLGIALIFKRDGQDAILNFFVQNAYGYFILFIQLVYFLFNYYYGVNKAGHDSYGVTPWYFSYFFILFSADNLFLIYLFLVDSSKLRSINIFVYILSSISRGWMGGVLFLFVNYFLERNISIKKFTHVFFVCLVLIAFLPFLINAKWLFRSISYQNGVDLLPLLFDVGEGYLTILFNSINYVVNRFQHFSSLVYILDNKEMLVSNVGRYNDFWMDGLPQLLFFRLFSLDYPSLNGYIVTDLFGYSNATWNIQIGMGAWILLYPYASICLLGYVAVLLIVAYRLPINRYESRVSALILFFSYSFIYVGWFGAFVNLLITLIISNLILSFLNKINYSK